MKNLIIVFIVGLIIGFFIGRSTIKEGEVKYVKGDIVRDTVPVPYPVEVEVPKYIKLPMKKDTLWVDKVRYITEHIDTATIIKDYIIERTYSLKVFDDMNGKLDATAKVGYNKLLGFSYDYTPLQKHVIIKEKKLFTPFVSGSYHTYKALGVGGGVFIKDLGVEYLYNVSLGDIPNYHTIGLKVKF